MDRQICYVDSLEDVEVKRNFTIERAPKNGSSLRRLIWSNLIVICKTHWRGRTQPCTWPNCEDCDRGSLPEVKGYLLTIVPKTEDKRLTEFTLRPAADLKQIQDEIGTLHGIGIELGRKNDRPNGPVYVRVLERGLNLAKFGPPPDLRPVLETMWRFNTDAVATANSKRARREMELGEDVSQQSLPQIDTPKVVSEVKNVRRKRS